jgi:antitoxin MazE
MKAKLVQIGNSRGVRLPKAVIDQAQLGDDLKIDVRGRSVVITSRRRRPDPRAGWDEAFAAALDGKPAGRADESWQIAPNAFDEEDWTW